MSFSANNKCLQIITKFSFSLVRYYSTHNNTVKPLNTWWVTGYTDAEWTFSIETSVAKTVKMGYTVRIKYQITVHYSDELILYRIKAFFNNVGKIIRLGNYVTYRVENLLDVVNEIIPHFDKYPVQSTKAISFYLFKASAAIIKNKRHLDLNGYKEMLSYKAALKKGLTANIFQHSEFSNIVPFNTAKIFIEKNTKLDPQYIAGFVAGDGSFSIKRPQFNGKWPNYDATFSIAQNKRDEALLNPPPRIIKTLGCGNISSGSNNMKYLSVRNKKEFFNIIIPFFT